MAIKSKSVLARELREAAMKNGRMPCYGDLLLYNNQAWEFLDDTHDEGGVVWDHHTTTDTERRMFLLLAAADLRTWE